MTATTTAWILAAGLGTRLRPLTDERPKPLVEVCGRPLIVHALQLLKDAGVREVAYNSHWLHPALPRALGNSVVIDDVTITLRATYEPVALGTGGGLLGLRAAAPSAARVLIANADALIDLDVRAFIAAEKKGDLATLALKAVPDADRYGVIGTDEHERVVTFAGRVPLLGEERHRRMFCGWHHVEPRALDVLARDNDVTIDRSTTPPTVTGTESCINKEGYPRWLNDGAVLRGFAHDGLFLDVGTPERLWEANRLLLTGEVPVAHLRPFARFEGRAGRVFVHPGARIDASARLIGPCVVDDGAVVEAGATIGPLAVVGPRVRVARGVTVREAVVQSGTNVDDDVLGVHVARHARVPLTG